MRLVPTPENTVSKPKKNPLSGLDQKLPSPAEVIEKRLEAHGLVEDDYAKEHQLLLVHKLLVRRATTSQIAEQLKITPSEAAHLIKDVKQRYAEYLRKKDPMELVAEGTAFYDEIIAESMKLYDSTRATPGLKVHDKVRALEMALKARVEKDKFLVNVGILNNNQNSEHTKEDHYAEEASSLKGLLADIMSSASEGLDAVND